MNNIVIQEIVEKAVQNLYITVPTTLDVPVRISTVARSPDPFPM